MSIMLPSQPSLLVTIALVLLHLVPDVASLASKQSNYAVPGHDGKMPGIVRAVSRKDHGASNRTFVFDEKERSDSAAALTQPSPSNRQSCVIFGCRSLATHLSSAVRSTFLPSGYPSKTPPGYLRHCMWSWAQDLSTQLRSVLATQRVLEGVGVGREGATALSASINFIVRDGCGMAATLLFTATAAGRFISDVKRWRIFADLAVDVGITLELLANAVPPRAFLPLICVANMCKAVCGVAAGACGSAINLHWAQGSDVSDINAKSGAQHTVTGALGLISAALFARSVSDASGPVLWSLYGVLTALHIFANVMCMKLVAFDRINSPRMALLASDFIDGWNGSCDLVMNPSSNTSTAASKKEAETHQSSDVPILGTPDSIARREPLFFLWRKPSVLPSSHVRMGVSFDEFAALSEKSVTEPHNMVTKKATRRKNEDARVVCHSGNYCITVGRRWRSKYRHPRTRSAVGPKHDRRKRRRKRRMSDHCILVAFLFDVESTDKERAYLHAVLLGRALERKWSDDADEASIISSAEAEAEAEISKAWPAFTEGASKAGWNLQGGSDIGTEGYIVELSYS